MTSKSSEIGQRADFSYIRYSQCWEDTRVVLDALNIQENDVCVSIASAGDNSLALLAKNPSKVIALDLNPAQLALVDLKIAAIKHLKRDEVLVLLGYKKESSLSPELDRLAIFARLSPALSLETREYFVSNIHLIEMGLASSGKFENYFKIFRSYVLPLIHRKKTINELVQKKSYAERLDFYNQRWNTLSWQLMFKIFFSNKVMGMLGRDPQFFKYANQSLPEFLKTSVYNALVNEDPSVNPYLHWILFGEYKTVLPFWLEETNYALIKKNIDKIELKEESMEDFLNGCPQESIDCWNLSDIFEYMSEDNYKFLLKLVSDKSASGARLAYWNMLVPRSVKNEYGFGNIFRDDRISEKLYKKNQTFFYTRFNLEVIGQC